MVGMESLQYLFDIQGYLVLKDVLSKRETDTLNQLVDVQELDESTAITHSRFGIAPEGAGFLEYGQPFCDLLDHATIMEILRMRLGDWFRLDRIYGIHGSSSDHWKPHLHADYGAIQPLSPILPGEYYHPRRNEILDGFVVVSWNLTDTGPDYGGFHCIPGSHKANYRLPETISQAPEESAAVIIPDAPAGSVTLFTESLTHGTARWRAPHRRRSLLYKYSLTHLVWQTSRVQKPENFTLTDRQRTLLSEPGDPRFVAEQEAPLFLH